MSLAAAAGGALFTKTQQRVLGLLFGKPDQRFYANEIVRQVDMGRGTVRRELQRLTDSDILTQTKEGKQHYYQANSESPIYSELLGIVRKTFGIADIIRQALKPVEEQIQLAFIYGSIAKSTDNKTSDIDLMVVGESITYSEIVDHLILVEEELGRPINPTIFTHKQFQKRITEEQSFILRVLDQPKLMIKGVINEFGQSVQYGKPA